VSCICRPINVCLSTSIHVTYVKVLIPDSVSGILDETGRALDELEKTIAKMMTEAGVDQ